jgi:integrase
MSLADTSRCVHKGHHRYTLTLRLDGNGMTLTAGVANCRPHRFRDTLAVDMLARGGSPYDVAKVLGDTIQTIEKHYAPFVRELRERVRTILESDAGLEKGANLTGHNRVTIVPKTTVTQ